MISVVLPVRDGERHLEEAIASVLHQRHADLELIVVDDGSRDASRTIAEAAARRDDRVEVIAGPPAGVAAALNRGVERARHPWVARMDADDVCLPERLSRQLVAATSRPEVVAWGTWAYGIDPAGRVISVVRQGPTTIEQFAQRHAVGPLRPIHSTMMVRRDALLDAGGYDPRFSRAQDIELWDRLSDLGPILTIPEPLLLVRVHADSATATELAESARTSRFVAARRAAANRGETLTYEAFLAAERSAPLVRRAAIWLNVHGQVLHRRAGVRYAEGRRSAATMTFAAAAFLAPRIVVPKAWRQFLAPRIFSRGDRIGSRRSGSP